MAESGDVIADTLFLAEGSRLAVVAGEEGLAAVPMARDGDGTWRRARPGDGVAEALLHLMAQAAGPVAHGRFTVHSWTRNPAGGERSVGVDQTNESVIVGDAAVVKWATHLQDGPHPAPRRISVLRDARFGGMPKPWGLVTWRTPHGTETMVASVDDYLPGAVDGWTWAVDLITDAARNRSPTPFATAAADVGTLVAELHSALSGTVTIADRKDAAGWRAAALATLETVCALGDSDSSRCAREHRHEIAGILDVLGQLARTPTIEGHGDLHVGQVLRGEGGFVITDFDGNPVLTAAQRMLPIPAVLDVAGMVQSLAHAAIVASKHTPLKPAAVREVDRAGRAAFLDAYRGRLAELGHADLFDPRPLRALRLQQVLREIVYAAKYLPRWMYVPDAALPGVLDEGTQR